VVGFDFWVRSLEVASAHEQASVAGLALVDRCSGERQGSPVLGASKTTDWIIDGPHMAERYAQFLSIALGESLLITGATFAARPFSTNEAIGAASASFSTIAIWWIYFHAGSEHAAQQIQKAADPGKTAFVTYTYIHIGIAAGIIVAAVGDEIVIVHPDHADVAGIATIIGGAALFLTGCLLFKWVSYERKIPPLSHAVGLLSLSVLFAGAQAHWFSTTHIGIFSAPLLLVVAAWDTSMGHHRVSARSLDKEILRLSS
jgi:low temperature requirement protein LtrA